MLRLLMMQRGFMFLALIALLAGCKASDDVVQTSEASGPEATSAALATAIFASAEPPYNPQAVTAELETAVSLWNSHNITAYSIEVRHARPTWNTQIIKLVVEDGIVSDFEHTCYPERDCVLRDVDPQSMTVENMYDVARQIIPLVDLNPEVTFNHTYGYPTAIGNNDAGWVFDTFEIIAPTP
ncbi:MAG: hypothetical protein KC421_02885 [Anaerolineales bacterium]|nr:hypothetical protein [Anaerolineales bacterium]